MAAKHVGARFFVPAKLQQAALLGFFQGGDPQAGREHPAVVLVALQETAALQPGDRSVHFTLTIVK